MDNGHRLDLTNDPDQIPSGGRKAERQSSPPFIGIHFTCCRVYGRLYLRPGRQRYQTHCPRCGKRLQVEVQQGDRGQDFVRVH